MYEFELMSFTFGEFLFLNLLTTSLYTIFVIDVIHLKEKAYVATSTSLSTSFASFAAP